MYHYKASKVQFIDKVNKVLLVELGMSKAIANRNNQALTQGSSIEHITSYIAVAPTIEVAMQSIEVNYPDLFSWAIAELTGGNPANHYTYLSLASMLSDSWGGYGLNILTVGGSTGYGAITWYSVASLLTPAHRELVIGFLIEEVGVQPTI